MIAGAFIYRNRRPKQQRDPEHPADGPPADTSTVTTMNPSWAGSQAYPDIATDDNGYAVPAAASTSAHREAGVAVQATAHTYDTIDYAAMTSLPGPPSQAHPAAAGSPAVQARGPALRSAAAPGTVAEVAARNGGADYVNARNVAAEYSVLPCVL